MKAVWYGITGLLAAFAAVIAWYSYDRMKSAGTSPDKPGLTVESKTKPAPVKAPKLPASPEKPKAASKADTKPAETAKTGSEAGPAAAKAKTGSDTGSAAPARTAPSFDVVRVEPDGSAVIAGRAQPGWKVVVRSKGVVIGEAVANSRGEWVIISDKPIATGSSDLKLTASSPDNTMTLASSQIVAISRPAATLKAPGKMAEAEIPGTKTPETAKAKPETAAKTKDAGASAEKPPETGNEADTAAAKRSSESKTQTTDTGQDVPAKPARTEPEAPIVRADSKAPPTTEKAGGAEATPQEAAAQESAPQESVPQKTKTDAVAKAPAKMPDAEPDMAKTTRIAEAEKPETKAPLAKPVAAPPVEKPAGTGKQDEKPAIKAESAPPAEVKSEVAKATQPAKPLIVVSEPGKASRVLQTPAEEPVDEKLRLSFRSVDYNDKGQVILSGKAKEGSILRVYLDNDFIGSTTSNAQGVWELKTRTPVDPGKYTLRVDQIGKGNHIAARVEAPFERAAPEAVKQARINGQVVIQPGDNLWNISRSLYGHGVQYTIIYEANKNKIRDPDLIYPGQIFTTPGADPAASGK